VRALSLSHKCGHTGRENSRLGRVALTVDLFACEGDEHASMAPVAPPMKPRCCPAARSLVPGVVARSARLRARARAARPNGPVRGRPGPRGMPRARGPVRPSSTSPMSPGATPTLPPQNGHSVRGGPGMRARERYR